MAVACGSMSARFVVSFDIPEVCFGAQDACGITCEPSGEPGHFDIRGDMEELKRYRTSGLTSNRGTDDERPLPSHRRSELQRAGNLRFAGECPRLRCGAAQRER